MGLLSFLKVIFPAGDETAEDVEELLQLAMESRKRVKDQLFRIDATYPDVDFYYSGSDGEKRHVQTVEEQEFPQFYYLKPASDPKQQDQSTDGADVVIDAEQAPTDATPRSKPAKPLAEEGHHLFSENRKGVSYDKLFGPYLVDASRIVVTDPYIRYFYQIKNMMEFVEMVIQRKAPEDQVAIHLVTGPDDGNVQKQRELLESITEACTGCGVDFTWAFDGSGAIPMRHCFSAQSAVGLVRRQL